MTGTKIGSMWYYSISNKVEITCGCGCNKKGLLPSKAYQGDMTETELDDQLQDLADQDGCIQVILGSPLYEALIERGFYPLDRPDVDGRVEMGK
jgi:hypothetical protein